jgi:hypothetical protein
MQHQCQAKNDTEVEKVATIFSFASKTNAMKVTACDAREEMRAPNPR